MKTLLLLLLPLLVACAPQRLPQPTSRAEACARIAQPVDLGMWEFCEPGAAAQCGQWRLAGTVCRSRFNGSQNVCDYALPFAANTAVPPRSCLQGNAGADCPPWWRCEQLPATADYQAGNYCVPGPPCSSDADAGR
jgi:hypothetical protein